MKFRALSGLCILAGPLFAQTAPQMVWTTSAQTGLADTFQMTLGGMFGEGPAFQNRLTTGLSNVFRAGDSVSLYGWNTLDLRSRTYNWQAGVGYKLSLWKKGRNALSVGPGLQRWLLPSVKSGANDWLVAGNLVYQSRIPRAAVIVTGDSWTLLTSSLPRGSLLHTQVWLQHDLWKRERVRIAFRHGPAHTYSWGFYGATGNRVFRYQTLLAITWKNTSVEGGYRKQWGLQPGIHDNNFWQFGFTRTVSRPIAHRAAGLKPPQG